jgi:hypothetical protein
MSAEVHTPPALLGRIGTPALVVGVVGLVLCFGGWLVAPEQFFRSYLVAYVFWVGIALGSLAILMIHYLTGGAWGLVIRRELESATKTLPLLALLFVPLIFGMHSLYSWTHADVVRADEHLRHKQAYLNTTFFIVRWAAYFAVWLTTAYLLNRWSREQDGAATPQLALRLERLSGPGLFALAVTITFALVDWVMSLEPDWYSTIYAVSFMAGEMLNALAFAVATVALLLPYKPLSDALLPRHFRDLGSLLLTFVMLWAYCAFSQFLLIWSGNLRDEIPWYLHRVTGGWGWVGAALIVFHFFLPFLLLLQGDIKRRARRLALVACLVIAMRFVDVLWLVAPVFTEKLSAGNLPELAGHLALSLLALVGTGGLWLWVFARELGGRPLLPFGDPYMKEAFSGERE